MDCIDPQLTANERTTLSLVAPTKQEAIDRMYPGWARLNVEMDRLRGWPAPQRRDFLAQVDAASADFVGDPDDVA